MFFKFRRRNHGTLNRLTRWALDESVASSDLEQVFGPEHAEELGALGWLFRAIENRPHEEPSLGAWQRFEKELRQRLRLLPPPPRLHGAALLPLILLPSAMPADARAAAGDLTCKCAADAAVTMAISAQIITSDLLDQIRRNEAALTLGDVDMTSMSSG